MRVRFAPSPTGALHIGGARTALYNWLMVRGAAGRDLADGAELLLRIEDTDRERSTPENVEQILDALRWLGLDWDGEPTFQTGSEERHREVVAQLLRDGRAYRSTATADDVKAYKAQHGAAAGFRGEALPADVDDPTAAVRLRVPPGTPIVVRDVIRGETTFAPEHLDDPVVARGDGRPLYNLAVAVDDHDAGITHVVRGEDHLSNTPKQLLVYAALGAEPPVFAHLPLLHGPDGKKLSKRHGAASVQELREQGFLPDAVVNELTLLGWGDPDDEQIIPRDELVRRFTIERVSKNAARFDEQKLRWRNGRYVRAMSVEDLTTAVAAHLRRAGHEDAAAHPGLRDAVAISQEKISTLADFLPLAGFLLGEPVDDPKARARFLDEAHRAPLRAAREALAAAEPFDVPTVEAALRAVPEAVGAKPKDVFQPVRVALSGTTVSPGVWESAVVLGRDATLARLDAALTPAA